MTEITINILEDDRKLTKFIIDYFNITDIKITNGKESIIKNTNIKIVNPIIYKIKKSFKWKYEWVWLWKICIKKLV